MTRRRKIRLAGCVIALGILAVLPAGVAVAHAGDRLLVVLYWIACSGLLLALLGIAILDILETVRMVKHARIKNIRDTMLPPEHD